MVTFDTLQEFVKVVSEANLELATRVVNAGFAVQREARRKLSKRTLGTRISAAAARALGLPEDTVSANLGRILGTNTDGAHVFLFEAFRAFLPTRTVEDGITREIKDAAEKGTDEFDSALRFVRDGNLRDKLERRFRDLADRTGKRGRRR